MSLQSVLDRLTRLRNPQQQIILARHQQQLMQHQQGQMEREGSGIDMNGRPRSPSSGENAPSPSKRQRIEGQFPGQQAMANGRFGPGMPGQQQINNSMHAQALLKQNDIDPSMLSSANFNTFQQQPPNIQKRALDAYSQSLSQNARQNMPQPMNGAAGQMLQPGMDQMEFYGGNGMRQGMAQNGGGQGSSNHALQDYQMQLMLLEQQNKKRLLMARQEQDGSVRPDQGPGMPGQPGFAPNMSPSGSRNGPSPNPSEQMKRGTPKMGQAGLPGSPMPADMPHGRGSPGAMNLNGAMSFEMMQQMESMKGMPMGQNGMRPPSSHPNGFNGGPVSQQQIEVMRQQAQAQGRAMPNGANWQQGPQGQAPGGVSQAAPSQNGQMGTPRAGNAAMPPPQSVPAANANNTNNNNANGRPASPAQPPAAASTPQTTNKPAPSKKKTKENTKVGGVSLNISYIMLNMCSSQERKTPQPLPPHRRPTTITLLPRPRQPRLSHLSMRNRSPKTIRITLMLLKQQLRKRALTYLLLLLRCLSPKTPTMCCKRLAKWTVGLMRLVFFVESQWIGVLTNFLPGWYGIPHIRQHWQHRQHGHWRCA